MPKELTQEQIADQQRLAEEWASKQYQRDREQEYPRLEECLHALLDGGDHLTELQNKRAEVKAKFPKPE